MCNTPAYLLMLYLSFNALPITSFNKMCNSFLPSLAILTVYTTTRKKIISKLIAIFY